MPVLLTKSTRRYGQNVVKPFPNSIILSWISSSFSLPQFVKTNADNVESDKTSGYIPGRCRTVEVCTFRKLEARCCYHYHRLDANIANNV